MNIVESTEYKMSNEIRNYLELLEEYNILVESFSQELNHEKKLILYLAGNKLLDTMNELGTIPFNPLAYVARSVRAEASNLKKLLQNNFPLKENDYFIKDETLYRITTNPVFVVGEYLSNSKIHFNTSWISSNDGYVTFRKYSHLQIGFYELSEIKTVKDIEKCDKIFYSFENYGDVIRNEINSLCEQ